MTVNRVSPTVTPDFETWAILLASVIGIASAVIVCVIVALVVARKKKKHTTASKINAVSPRVTSELLPADVLRPEWIPEHPILEWITCGTCIAHVKYYVGLNFCPYCGAELHVELPRPVQAPSMPIQPVQEIPLPASTSSQPVNGGGAGLCTLGGILSILLGLAIPLIYPEIFLFGFAVVGFILIATVITGGIITLVGVGIVSKNLKLGQKIIIIGALVSGLNLITLFGVGRLKENK